MKKETDNTKKFLIAWLIILTVISVIVLCRTFYSEVELKIDYLGVIVGILALLCTVLIGWQIYTFFDFSKREEYSGRRIHELEEHITQTDFIFNSALADTYANILNQPEHHPTYNLLQYRIMSLIKASQLEQSETIDKLCNEIISGLIKIINDNEIILNMNEKVMLLDILMNVYNRSRFPEFKDLYGKIVMLYASPSESPKDKKQAESDNINNE